MNLNTTSRRRERIVNLSKSEKSPTLQTSASQQKKRRAWEMQSGAAKDTSEERLSQSFWEIQSQRDPYHAQSS